MTLLADSMLTERDALSAILAAVRPLETEELRLFEAGNRILAEAVVARINLPRFDNSSMDGYAVRAADAVAGAVLRVTGEQPAGPDQGLKLEPGTAVRVYTGAPIPAGANAVVMQEDCDRQGDLLTIRETVSPGEFIRSAGGDLCEGQKIVDAGVRLSGPLLATLASQGVDRIHVFRQPKVAVLATGSELRSPGESLGPGEIYETNRVMLQELIRNAGGIPHLFDPVPDQEDKHLRALREAESDDVIVIAGGVSVGERDLVKSTLQKLGCEIELWRVAVRPGKPFLFGRLNRRWVFGLPGNPVSTFVTFLLFVRPALLTMQGWRGASLTTSQAILSKAVINRGERPHYLRGHLEEGRFMPFGNQESHALFALSRANALLQVGAGQQIPEYQTVEVLLLP
jgi:molybdopterin molybdotransferase